jgi:alkylation response protein AidB-like acyl-CoA dehydrogenase
MPLFLDDEQTMLKDTAKGFLQDAAPVSHLRKLRDDKDATGFSPALWSQFAELGFTGILIPETDGGLGLGAVEAGIVLEQIGRNLTPSPFLSTSVGAVTALKAAGQGLRDQYLPAIAAGSITAALAIDEGSRHRPERIALSAERRGNGFALSGQKTLVIGGHVADLLIVAARTAGAPGETAGLTLFAIDAKAAGVSAEVDRLADSSLASRLSFDAVEVDADAVIGQIDNGWEPLGAVLSQVRAGASAELVGVASGAMDRTVQYLRERTQFGRVIGEFQALQHRAAHLYSEIEVATAAVLKAQQLLDGGSPDAEAAAMVAKAQAGLTSLLAVQEGLQMHGGIGMTDEHDIGLYMKRQRVLAEMYGDTDGLADRLARLAGY